MTIGALTEEDTAALAEMIQGLNEQHTLGCSCLEDDGSGCDCCLPAAAAFLELLRDKLAARDAEIARLRSWHLCCHEMYEASRTYGHQLGCSCHEEDGGGCDCILSALPKEAP